MSGAVGRDQLSLAIRSPFSAAPTARRPAQPNRTGMLGKDSLTLGGRPVALPRSRVPAIAQNAFDQRS